MHDMRLLATAGILLLSLASSAQKKTPSVKPPLVSAITEADLKKDLFAMADDHFRGREAGTLDELRVSAWWADQMKAAGLKPAGDDGTWFQFFTMKRNRVSRASTLGISGRSLALWTDVLVAQTAPASISAPVVYAGTATKTELDALDLKGKAVAVQVSADQINMNISLPARRYPGFVQRKYAQDLLARGAVAIIFIADATGEASWSQVVPAMSRGSYNIEGEPGATVATRAPVLWVHGALGESLRSGATLNATIQVESFDYPSVNIVGRVEGTDRALKSEYVLFSSHQDHDGVRQPYGTDSIYNGADDNGTVSVALLAAARAFHKQPGRRSALFVWHGAEERGLLGSKWFSAHPTVRKESIVAVLNGDMIGRNNADSAALLGMQAPHRNSSDLVRMALEANNEGPRFRLDTLWDKPEHVEGWYFRSDHLPYARAGIPALMYTTLLHPDYHTPMDEAAAIDIRKLRRMTEWMYRTGWKVANAEKRPAADPGFKLER
ncbi:MAG: family peptidase [Flaviaesturariibacter sp.]|nr:family peptidase [Flaviaesturariibacter sp.]